MIKKILLFLCAVVPTLASAQVAMGSWRIYQSYDTPRRYNDGALAANTFVGYQALDTPDKVYIVSEKSLTLFSYDKETEEVYSYTKSNLLNDNIISGIWYNKKNKYLLISYDNGNIDLLYDDGKVYNLPDIKNAVMTITKGINDVAFDNNTIYVATTFGIVQIDDQNHFVVQSGNYSQNVDAIASVGDYIVALSGNSLRYIKKTDKYNSWDNFTSLGSFYGNNFIGISDTKMLCRSTYGGSGYTVRLMDFDFENATFTYKWVIGAVDVDYIEPLNNGEYWVRQINSGLKSFVISSDGTTSTEKTLPDAFSDGTTVGFSFYGHSSVWCAGRSGITEYDLTGDSPVIKRDKTLTNNLKATNSTRLKFGNSNALYIAGLGASSWWNAAFWNYQALSRIHEDGTIEDLNCYKTQPHTHSHWDPQQSCGYSTDIWDVTDMVEDPEDPDVYYVGSRWDGIYKITKNANGEWESLINYSVDNSNFKVVSNWGVPAYNIRFDKNNNMWVSFAQSGTNNLHMLPAEKRKLSSVTASDWVTINIADLNVDNDGSMLMCQHSNFIFITDSSYNGHVLAYDHKGTTDTSDDEYYVWSVFLDQDGKSFTNNYIYCTAEDNDGKIWIGTYSGVFEISNPSDALNPNAAFTRIKVPRNDGSGYADYLCDSQAVTSIAVDGANRKWVGTETSGLYLVSPSGDEILENFTSDNSDLPDNLIYSIACSPYNNSVWISTKYGLAEYSSDSTPAADNFNDVYAYPNPVRPGYTGWIVIKGLMDGSRVKIADAAGNVFLDTTSTGGMVAWDGCNASGQRVRTGVYYVYASVSGEGVSTEGAVTKILVVN